MPRLVLDPIAVVYRLHTPANMDRFAVQPVGFSANDEFDRIADTGGESGSLDRY